jgi:hypothetical protein
MRYSIVFPLIVAGTTLVSASCFLYPTMLIQVRLPLKPVSQQLQIASLFLALSTFRSLALPLRQLSVPPMDTWGKATTRENTRESTRVNTRVNIRESTRASTKEKRNPTRNTTSQCHR